MATVVLSMLAIYGASVIMKSTLVGITIVVALIALDNPDMFKGM